MKHFRMGLLPRIATAIVLGVLVADFLPVWGLRLFETFRHIFSQVLGFLIPLIILGLVAPAITDIGSRAGKMLAATVALAYGMTIASGFFSFGVSMWLFPSLIDPGAQATSLAQDDVLTSFVTMEIPPLMDVMSALALALLLGVGATATKAHALKTAMQELREVMLLAIRGLVIPLLPIYIFCIFMGIAASGQIRTILTVFSGIIGIIFVMHVLVLLFQYALAGAITRRNPLRLLRRMMPAYFTALGTQSSAATIPVTMRQTLQNGVSHGTAGFVIPLCATIHLSGSILKIVACALALMMMSGHEVVLSQFVPFVFALAVCMVAAPGVPGGAVMAALGILTTYLGFTESDLALMIALYAAMDCFGTACNVTGDGALALIIDHYFVPRHK